MPKQPTFPTLFDDVIKIESSKFNEWGYFQPNQILRSELTWWRGENKRAAISIDLNTYKQNAFVELNFSYAGEPRSQTVYFVSTPSNLGRGEVWYFLCPITQKRCRKLYCVDGYFGHRTAFSGVYYEKQTYSKRKYSDCQFADQYFGSDQAWEEIYSKHFKKYYAGKPTKCYLRLCEKIRRASMISLEEFYRRLTAK